MGFAIITLAAIAVLIGSFGYGGDGARRNGLLALHNFSAFAAAGLALVERGWVWAIVTLICIWVETGLASDIVYNYLGRGAARAPLFPMADPREEQPLAPAHPRLLNLPAFHSEYIADEGRITDFVFAFLATDSRAGQLLNRSNLTLFAEGYRPQLALACDVTADPVFADLRTYFARRLFIDLSSIELSGEEELRRFLDKIGDASDKTTTRVCEIAESHDLDIMGRFVFEKEIVKIPAGAEREELKRNWLNDAFLSTELRVLAWVYHELFGRLYVTPDTAENETASRLQGATQVNHVATFDQIPYGSTLSRVIRNENGIWMQINPVTFAKRPLPTDEILRLGLEKFTNTASS
jgi:hypothetical protein